MNKKKIIVFHPALAPYRVDFFNSLAENFDCEFYFFSKNLISQKFDQSALRQKIKFEPKFLKGFFFLKKHIRFGVFKILRKYKPDIVIGTEFNWVNICTIFYRVFFLEILNCLPYVMII